MKLIADVEKKTLRILENERSIFRGEYGADKLELYINKQLENEYPTITALLSNGRKIGAYSTDDAYSIEEIDGEQYTKATFTLSKANGFTLSEGKMQITIWMNNINGNKQALGNVILNVINTTAFDDGDIIVSGDVEGTLVNYKVELENLQGQVNTFNGRITNAERDIAYNLEHITILENNKADKSEIPTKVSELTNDAGFVTKKYADTKAPIINTLDGVRQPNISGKTNWNLWDTFVYTYSPNAKDSNGNLVYGGSPKLMKVSQGWNPDAANSTDGLTIVQRTKTGTITTANPIGPNDAVPLEYLKKYVEQNAGGGSSNGSGKYTHTMEIKCDASGGNGYAVTIIDLIIKNDDETNYSVEDGDNELIESTLGRIKGTYIAFCEFWTQDFVPTPDFSGTCNVVIDSGSITVDCYPPSYASYSVMHIIDNVTEN